MSPFFQTPPLPFGSLTLTVVLLENDVNSSFVVTGGVALLIGQFLLRLLDQRRRKRRECKGSLLLNPFPSSIRAIDFLDLSSINFEVSSGAKRSVISSL
ncbi:hypothetical protein RJT34_24269 [Clitoria ternatea]|uniref:Uncharacterized protein n=1 Tax=Clitoria ternatea TaxID=43366 RepID=A0AAN9FUB5_CLITE